MALKIVGSEESKANGSFDFEMDSLARITNRAGIFTNSLRKSEFSYWDLLGLSIRFLILIKFQLKR